MATMIERVARAMQAVDSQAGRMYEMSDAESLVFARAAVAAMREPTEGMHAAGEALICGGEGNPHNRPSRRYAMRSRP